MPVSLDLEASLWDAGAAVVVGMDEVGRGSLAGPVMVGAVAVTRCDTWPDGLADSKELSARRREEIAVELTSFGVARAVGSASNDEVDTVGIVGALRLAGWRALEALARDGVTVDEVLLDGRHDWLTAPPIDLFAADGPFVNPPRIPPVTMVVKGDGRCASIAAASVLAKVERDAVMIAAHDSYPAFGWSGNKGYGAAEHMAALVAFGPTPLHRTSWNLPAASS